MSNFITNTIDLVRSEKFYNVSELIEIAKGRNEMATNFKIGFRKLNRKIRSNDDRKKD